MDNVLIRFPKFRDLSLLVHPFFFKKGARASSLNNSLFHEYALKELGRIYESFSPISFSIKSQQ